MSQDGEDRRARFEAEALPHLDAVYRFALRLSASEDRAQDLVQETFLRAWRAWDQYTAGTRAKSWLFTICRNLFLRQEDRGRRHDQIVEREATRDGNPSGPDIVNPVWVSTLGADPEGSFFDSIVDDQVLEAIDGLPEEYRTALVMSDLEGLSYQAIADATRVPVGTVKSRIFRARRQLQQILYDYAVEMGYIPARTEAPGTGQGGGT